MFRLHITNSVIGTILLSAVYFQFLVEPAKAQESTHAQEYAARAQYDQTKLQTYLEALQPYAEKLNEQERSIAAIKVKLAQSKGNTATKQSLQKQLSEYTAQRAISQSYVQQLQGYIDSEQRLIAEDRSIIQQDSISDTANEAYQEALQEQKNLAQLSANNNAALNEEDGYGYGGYGYGRYGYGGYGYNHGYTGSHEYIHSSGGHASGHHSGGTGRR